tara:strand:+ start:76 stop:285 length:210 start_codon:yes stop_codon:yes gene_type:complete
LSGTKHKVDNWSVLIPCARHPKGDRRDFFTAVTDGYAKWSEEDCNSERDKPRVEEIIGALENLIEGGEK